MLITLIAIWLGAGIFSTKNTITDAKAVLSAREISKKLLKECFWMIWTNGVGFGMAIAIIIGAIVTVCKNYLN